MKVKDSPCTQHDKTERTRVSGKFSIVPQAWNHDNFQSASGKKKSKVEYCYE